MNSKHNCFSVPTLGDAQHGFARIDSDDLAAWPHRSGCQGCKIPCPGRHI